MAKNNFKETYDRVVEETKALREKYNKLDKFIHSDKFFKLEEIDRNDLAIQKDAMSIYLTVLGRRMERMKDELNLETKLKK